jgi:hypothetical protein
MFALVWADVPRRWVQQKEELVLRTSQMIRFILLRAAQRAVYRTSDVNQVFDSEH